MPSLTQQLTALATEIERRHDAIPVEADTVGVTLEQHSPGNGIIYTRLRAPKGKALANGKGSGIHLQPGRICDTFPSIG